MERRKLVVRIIAAVIIAALLGGSLLSWIICPNIGEYTEYKFDVKNFHMATTIEVEKSGEDFATVKGNVWKFVTDPLTMYDTNENKLAYAGDEYHFLAQDSHSIVVNDTVVEMVGRVNFIGETYDIYDADQKKIPKLKINYFNTEGKLYDADGNIIAVYRSFPFFNDFNVRVSDDCELDENVVVMVFSSYYSDHKFDESESSGSSSRSKSK